jgi:dienelactone hydrolase
MSASDPSSAAVLFLHEPTLARAAAASALARLGAHGFATAAHELSTSAMQSDRDLTELDRALAGLCARSGVDPERTAVLGFGRGGTLAFLLGCTRRVAAVVDVDGPVLHPALGPARPIQPLELALNFEGAFLGLFAPGTVGAGEIELLRARLAAAARPFDLVVDPHAGGEELWPRVLAFLDEHLRGDDA